MTSKVTKKDMIRLLRFLDQTPHPVSWNVTTKELTGVTGEPIHLRVAHRAVGEGFVVIEREIHLLLAGEKFLRHWRWRWLKRIGIAAGALVVGLDSLVSLIAAVAHHAN
ncbi:MAG: hypothetical protein F4238_12690 [Gemmatimonadetes bacterium]|nr:hypothetical protein [Gammaproteobacteria bacterium]MYE94206.1 hypothetical protein [Gemmatimonadota bacterium]